VTRRVEGQSLVEFALVLPLFLLLVFALIDFTRLMYTYVSLSNAAREMARVAAVTTNWSSANAVTTFNNYAMFAGGRNGATDSVTIVTGNAACARARDTGGACSPAPTSVLCPMTTTPTASPPLSSCTLTRPSSSGFVEVSVSYRFQYNPLFQNRLVGVADFSIMRSVSQLTTTSRAYVE
jgi:Flp pilus assembly protein TadG